MVNNNPCVCNPVEFNSCPWDGDTQLKPHRLQFHFQHDPRFDLFHAIACTTNGHNLISYLLRYHELKFSNGEWFHSRDEALLYYVAHLLYLSLVTAKTDALGRQKEAANGETPEPVDFRETALLQSPELGGYQLSPFGQHFSSLLYSQNLTVMAVQCNPRRHRTRKVDRYACC